MSLSPLGSRASYPNAFRDLLGKSESEISAKVEAAFQQLFHGDASTQAIYVPLGTNQAYIEDILHDEPRTEGIGLGMMIAVALGKRDEFDRLWRYVKSIQEQSGPAQGYIPSFCGGGNGADACYDPYGFQQITTAVLLARGRWQATATDIDYAFEAASLLDVIRHREIYNCGLGDVSNLFDTRSKLPYDSPTAPSVAVSHPSFVMPAYYELWSEATGDPFWSAAAAAGRAYWQATADPKTGLVPERAGFDASSVPDHDIFNVECLRTFFSMALDRTWTDGQQAWLVDEGNRLLQFFYGKGLSTYGYAYSLDGNTVINSFHDTALIAANGTLALVGTSDNRRDFVNEVWNLQIPTGSGRYYPGINLLTALVILSGQMRVY